jgi:hypothetical protein
VHKVGFIARVWHCACSNGNIVGQFMQMRPANTGWQLVLTPAVWRYHCCQMERDSQPWTPDCDNLTYQIARRHHFRPEPHPHSDMNKKSSQLPLLSPTGTSRLRYRATKFYKIQCIILSVLSNCISESEAQFLMYKSTVTLKHWVRIKQREKF